MPINVNVEPYMKLLRSSLEISVAQLLYIMDNTKLVKVKSPESHIDSGDHIDTICFLDTNEEEILSIEVDMLADMITSITMSEELEELEDEEE